MLVLMWPCKYIYNSAFACLLMDQWFQKIIIFLEFKILNASYPFKSLYAHPHQVLSFIINSNVFSSNICHERDRNFLSPQDLDV